MQVGIKIRISKTRRSKILYIVQIRGEQRYNPAQEPLIGIRFDAAKIRKVSLGQ